MIVRLLVLCMWGYTLSSDVVVTRRGSRTVLQCHPGDNLVGIIWKIYHTNNAFCLVSHAAHLRETPLSYSSCSNRMTLTSTYLTIQDTQISDEGNYTCEISYHLLGTFINTSTLQVLAEPSVSLERNSAGSPECRAIGGYPAAEISWIPHSYNINTTQTAVSDQSWTVISTYGLHGDNVTSVTCSVSHPLFDTAWIQSVEAKANNNIYIWVPAVVAISLVILAGSVMYWKRKPLRARFKKSLNTSPPHAAAECEQETQEFEPYAIYTKKDNVLYCKVTNITYST
ncbi:cell surface glycoprotein CD200 receptor 1-A-like isoform X2 [Hyperolius riggenbachi]|uniref:cell surface glycoprotein CD200 receptor 1-A-like isoform X2 n=1 Tax=Hyperolius riggenbachi TaxID=752182 RepID=UPI0035A3B5D7